MSKAVASSLVFALMLAALPAYRAHSASPDSGEAEAVRRQNAVIETHLLLEKAHDAVRQGDSARAVKLYNDALARSRQAGGSAAVEKDTADIIAGLSAVNLQLAQEARIRGNTTEANDRIASVLKIDPRNAAAIDLKHRMDREAEEMKGRLPSPETQAKIPQVAATKLKAATLVQDGRLLMEMGKLNEAEAKLREAVKLDPQNDAAYYYLNILKGADYSILAKQHEIANKEAMVEVERYWNPPVKRESLPTPNPQAHTNFAHTGKGRMAIYQKLSSVRLKKVMYEDLPLPVVLEQLSIEAKKADPEGLGINFIISNTTDAGGGGGVDAATGAITPGGAPVDLNTVKIKLTPEINDIRLADALDAILKVADQGIKYSVEDYAIFFTPKPKNPNAPEYFTRTFKVDPNTFMQGLESVSGISFGDNLGSANSGGNGSGGGGGNNGGGGNQGGQGNSQETFVIPRVSLAASSGGVGGGRGGQGGGGTGGAQSGVGITGVTRTNLHSAVQDMVKSFFAASGVTLTPPATLFWNDRTGVLLVRATMQDLDLVEQAMQVLNIAPPQVTIDAKFVEVREIDSKALGFDWYLGNVLMNNKSIGGQAGTAPSFAGAPSPANPSGVFPNPPNAFAGAALPSASDGLLTSGLRNKFGLGSTQPDVPAVATLTGILTDPQFRMVVRALEQRQGIDVMAAPRVTTLSGRQTQIAVADIRTIVTSVDISQNRGANNNNAAAGGGANGAAIGTTVNFNTSALPFGPVLDVIPYVSADGYTVQMTIIPTLTEFVEYERNDAFVPSAQSAAGSTLGVPLTAVLPLPRLVSRQLVTSATVWDGQTIVLGGLIREDVNKFKDKVPVLGDMPLVGRFFRSESRSTEKRNLMIFVTPTIIDPAGNRVHTDDQLPFAQTSIPAQKQAAR